MPFESTLIILSGKKNIITEQYLKKLIENVIPESINIIDYGVLDNSSVSYISFDQLFETSYKVAMLECSMRFLKQKCKINVTANLVVNNSIHEKYDTLLKYSKF